MNRSAKAPSALLGGALLALALSAAPAQAAGNGSITGSISGVPSKVPAGGSFQISVTSRSSSDDAILVDQLNLTLYRSSGSAGGVSVQWQDPATGQWVDASGGGDSWSLGGRRGLATVPPHGTLVTHARISMGSATPGSYTVRSPGIIGYELLGPSGDPIAGHLDSIESAQVSFSYATGGGAAPQPTPSTRPTTPRTPSTPARTAAAPDAPADAPSTSPTPTPSATDTPTATATPTPADSAPTPTPTPTPSGATAAVAATGSARSATVPLTLGAVAVTAAAATFAIVALRRRRTGAERSED
ncbi:hypothetical protein [Streptomyces sp. TLI_171]|uniref:hypothetical protein n=1 Tax=Streptomyces sp. TLI_171 TaxID=1938859 RepID=UPI000C184676|nr:hypothetical protein [Streptomyces sp. TLI_171]RKE23572.1 hypothetical protein BX266_7047 [Streptomyces sp. TLI_171]